MSIKSARIRSFSVFTAQSCDMCSYSGLVELSFAVAAILLRKFAQEKHASRCIIKMFDEIFRIQSIVGFIIYGHFIKANK